MKDVEKYMTLQNLKQYVHFKMILKWCNDDSYDKQ